MEQSDVAWIGLGFRRDFRGFRRVVLHHLAFGRFDEHSGGDVRLCFNFSCHQRRVTSQDHMPRQCPGSDAWRLKPSSDLDKLFGQRGQRHQNRDIHRPNRAVDADTRFPVVSHPPARGNVITPSASNCMIFGHQTSSATRSSLHATSGMSSVTRNSVARSGVEKRRR